MGIKSQLWISSMTIVMFLVIFGSFAEVDEGEGVVDGKKTYGEKCEIVYSECNSDLNLVCVNEKCQCDPSYAIAKTKPKPTDPDPKENDTMPGFIPAKLEWNAEANKCVTKKNSPCLLDYDKLDAQDKNTFMDCKGKCVKGDGSSGRDDLGVCKGGKGKGGDAGNIQVNRILNFGLPCLLILLLLSAK